MMEIKIIFSLFIEKMKGIDANRISQEYDFFKDHLPSSETFKPELLQWMVSFKVCC